MPSLSVSTSNLRSVAVTTPKPVRSNRMSTPPTSTAVPEEFVSLARHTLLNLACTPAGTSVFSVAC